MSEPLTPKQHPDFCGECWRGSVICYPAGSVSRAHNPRLSGGGVVMRLASADDSWFVLYGRARTHIAAAGTPAAAIAAVAAATQAESQYRSLILGGLLFRNSGEVRNGAQTHPRAVVEVL